MENKYKSVKVTQGRGGGWGGPLIITPTEQKKYVISVTGGGIHPLAERIAELTGAEAIDGFNNPPRTEETCCAVIDCGGTARCGTYPKLRIPTININVQNPSGPLAKFMTEDLFCSGTKLENIQFVDGPTPASPVIESASTGGKKSASQVKEEAKEKVRAQKASNGKKENPVMKFIDTVGRGAGKFINIMYQAGRETIDTVIKNILPFMAFVATLIGIINYTGIGDIIGHALTPLAGSLMGLFILGVITGLPFLSPLLGPGAVIAAIVGILIGQELANGNIPPAYALPALFAINSQVGCDFIPVGMTLTEAEPETISTAVPAILFSRLITGPLAVIIAYFASFGL